MAQVILILLKIKLMLTLLWIFNVCVMQVMESKIREKFLLWYKMIKYLYDGNGDDNDYSDNAQVNLKYDINLW